MNICLKKLIFLKKYLKQGSVLGSMLFILYTNDLNKYLVYGGDIFQYADDTSSIIHKNNIQTLTTTTTDMITNMENWCHNNSLFLNIDKTGIIV